ncbi:hypothetical protein SASPL_145657 [Salvia splendens]|uniref:Uncharacterized protein n=1 Tax=Salvia splendens TaxID=180675 RepID=A0A8X8Z7W0_SALSN|nr:hypothetical protein SASPL_145656 [Salvia splendens]KAG6395066.1 hypothetical protein SASPL_145657 [Salvia splendens]
MAALVKKPLLMKKLQAEIRQLSGEKNLIDEKDMEKLPYLTAVVKESLRLYPPAPLLVPREMTKKYSVNGYEIEGGSTAYVNAWAIARDPAIWENEDEFLPERCPGIVMAMAEMKLALANVVCKFAWDLPVGMKEEDIIDFEVLPGITMHKKNALRLLPKLVIA